MINCGNSSFVGAMYSCPSCGNLKFVPFRCHSRFCPLAETNIPWNTLPLCPLN
nr:transposase zinc-binding domain-containing protein [uncultured Dorea sp.]